MSKTIHTDGGATETALDETILDLTSRDGLKLRARFWPGRGGEAIVLVAHGLGEHGGCYRHVAERLAIDSGRFDVLAIDFRGHGLSEGKRGVVGSYDELVDDLRTAVEWTTARYREGRRFLLAHSNGGQVALRALIDGLERIDGLVLSNPALAVCAHVPRWKLRAGRILEHLAPRLTLSSKLPEDALTRDREAWPSRRADSLRHSRVNAALFFGMIEGGPHVLAHASEIRVPTLLLLGRADPIISPEMTLRLYERLGSADRTLRVYHDGRHEPLNDLCREQVLEDLALWLNSRVNRNESGSADAG